MEKRQRDQQRKQKISENRKHLANVRVVQKNLVFVVGLPPRLADAEVSVTVYYYGSWSKRKLIVALIFASFQILKKHEYFGKYGKIHKVVINPSTTYAGVQGPSASAYVTYCSSNDALRAIQSVNNIMLDGRLIKTSLGTTKYCSHFMKNQQCPKPDCMYLHELGDLEASFTKEEMHQGKHQEYEKRLHDSLIAQTAAANNNNNNNNSNTNNNSVSSPTCKLSENNNKQASENDSQNGPEKSKEAWPSLSISPVNKETGKPIKNGNNKENGSGKKAKAEKTKNKKSPTNSTSSNGSTNSTTANSTSSLGGSSTSSKDSGKDSGFITKDTNSGESPKQTMSADEELNILSEIENDASSNDLDGKADTPSLSLSSSGDSGTVSESASGKSSPANFSDHPNENGHTSQQDVDKQQNQTNLEKNSHSLFNDNFSTSVSGAEINTNCHPLTSNNVIDTTARFSKLGLFDDNNSFFSSNTFQPSPFFKQLDSQTTQLRNADTNNQINSPQLPDLLSGTECDKERQDLHEKLNLLKGLGDFNSQLGSLRNSFGSSSGLGESQKRRNMVNGLGLIGNFISINHIDWPTILTFKCLNFR